MLVSCFTLWRLIGAGHAGKDSSRSVPAWMRQSDGNHPNGLVAVDPPFWGFSGKSTSFPKS